MKKKLIFYVSMLIVFGAIMYWIANEGNTLFYAHENVQEHAETKNLAEGFHLFTSLTLENVKSSVGLLLLQILIILAACRVVGWLFKKMGQPTVIGEILAGIILGPSLLGSLFPEAFAFLFPEESFSSIRILSQFGLILFMFTIGMELDIKEVGKRWQDTLLISHAGTIVPFALGMFVAYLIYDRYASAHTPFLSFALFVGISLSITAFPVLARIIQERGLTRSHLGTIALASAASGDITAWCLLAAVVAYAQAGTMDSALYTVLFSALYAALMLFIVRPMLKIVGNLYHNKEVVDKSLVALMFFILLASAYFTEILGLHALFGAFVAGIIMPTNEKFRKIMADKVEDVALALLLPLFFVYTGLRTEIGLISGAGMWLLTGIFILVAIVGKFGSTLVVARFSGENWKDSLFLGALMNTRGLMELVVLSIGLEMKILPPPIFVMLVLMTLVTTFMTTPLISFIRFCFKVSDRKKQHREDMERNNVFKVLLSFGRAGSGQVLLDLAHRMFSAGAKQLEVTALHLTVGSDVNPLRTDEFERESFEPILAEAVKLNMQIKTRYEVCEKAEDCIVSIVNKEGFDFLLVGSGISMSNLSTDVTAMTTWQKFRRLFPSKNSRIFYPGTLLRDKTKDFVDKSNASVGVFVNRNFVNAEHILLIINSVKDLILLNYVRTLQATTHGFVKLLNRVNPASGDSKTVTDALKTFLGGNENAAAIPFEKDITRDLLKESDLMLVTYDAWQTLTVETKDTLKDMPSTLLVEDKT
ncbi:MAG: cation:proton antiporter [Tannerella sp.]|jgi:Kef-type K+ transport system membrane component KefB|nr:cation:proton antiporter [Tannerella sp.]